MSNAISLSRVKDYAPTAISILPCDAQKSGAIVVYYFMNLTYFFELR